MSPRPYQSGQRRASAEQTRSRILRAARELIVTAGMSRFTIDAVARQAGVARMTVYYQFGSKRGLLEALFDQLASRGLAERLPAAYGTPDALGALAGVIAAFCAFWNSDRLVLRRVRGLAALDPEFEQAVQERDERRREGLRGIALRLTATHQRPRPELVEDAVDVLHTLTSFETFDALAGPTRSVEDVTALVQRLALAALDLEEGQPDGGAAGHPAPP